MPSEVYFFQKKFTFFQDAEKGCGYVMTPSREILDRIEITKRLEGQLTFGNQEQIEAIKVYNFLEVCEQELFDGVDYPYFIPNPEYSPAPLFSF